MASRTSKDWRVVCQGTTKVGQDKHVGEQVEGPAVDKGAGEQLAVFKHAINRHVCELADELPCRIRWRECQSHAGEVEGRDAGNDFARLAEALPHSLWRDLAAIRHGERRAYSAFRSISRPSPRSTLLKALKGEGPSTVGGPAHSHILVDLPGSAGEVDGSDGSDCPGRGSQDSDGELCPWILLMVPLLRETAAGEAGRRGRG